MAPDLAGGLDRVWTRLAAAVGDRDSPWRIPVVVTGGQRGPDGRSMVVRAVDRGTATLTFYTDVRAAKVAAVAGSPPVAVVAWDAGAQLQLRLRGVAAIVADGPDADAAWCGIGDGGRRAYRTSGVPGSAAASAGSAARVDAGDGRRNFAVLTIGVTALEWLDLAGDAHRRARYAKADGWRGEWCVP